MALNFKKYEREDRVELGTVASLAGKGGKIKFIPKNLADEGKRVAVIIEKANGDSDMVLCSEKLSEMVRSKEVKISHLIGFQVTEQLTRSGDMINVIVLPTVATGDLIEVAVGATKAVAFERTVEPVEHDDLIAF